MKEKKGISLIVLIVTIIVMIIIAGAVIISLTETNIIDQAEIAVEKHNESELKAAASMAYSNWLLEEKTGNNPGHAQDYIRKQLINQNIATWEDFSKIHISKTGQIEEIEDEDAFIFVLDIPEDNYMFTLGYISINEDTYTIDWGDGTIESEQTDEFPYHTYDKKGIYEVKLTGDLYGLEPAQYDRDVECISEIKSFGNLNLEYLWIYGGSNLKYLPNPNSNSFAKLSQIGLSLPAVQEIPDYFFKNCNALTIVNIDANITELPSHLFDGVNDISNIAMEFPEGVELPQ